MTEEEQENLEWILRSDVSRRTIRWLLSGDNIIIIPTRKTKIRGHCFKNYDIKNTETGEIMYELTERRYVLRRDLLERYRAITK